MSCASGLTIEAHRNADLKKTYTFPAGYNLAGVSPKMQVRYSQGDTGSALVEVTTTPNGYGSVFTIVGNSIVLLVDDQEFSTIPRATPPSDPNVLEYDIILTLADGFEQYFVGGPFILYPGVTL